MEPVQEQNRIKIGLQQSFSSRLVSSAVDSTPLLREGRHGILADRLRSDGYLAFSNFFTGETLKWAQHLVDVIRGPRTHGFEANLHTGEGWAEECKVGVRQLVAEQLRSKVLGYDALHDLLSNVLDCMQLVVPNQIEFQLVWVRGKGLGDATEIHMDYHQATSVERMEKRVGSHLEVSLTETKHTVDDVLSEDKFKAFNVWVNVSGTPPGSSCIAVSPGSHLLPLDSVRHHGYPTSFQEMISKGEARWQILDEKSGLAAPGTLLLMSLRLIHGATPSTCSDMRLSIDGRFRCPLKAGPGVVRGARPAPHWAECIQWTRQCHHLHPHLKGQIIPFLLVNHHLRATGEVWLLPDLVFLIFEHLRKMVTPTWEELRPVFRRAFERRRTGVIRFNQELEMEGTGSSPISSDLEFEATGTFSE